MTVCYSLRKLVTVSRNTVFKLEYLIGILIDLILGCSCKTDQGSIKIVEYILVFVVNRSMCFVYDNKVKMSYCEELFIILILYLVDAVHHCLISREDTSRIISRLILAEICNREIGEQIYEGTLCLCNERVSICEEENILHPAVLKKHLRKSNNCSCLTRTGCHDEKCLAAILLVKRFAYRLDCAFLVVSSCNITVNHNILKACTHCLQIEELLKITL